MTVNDEPINFNATITKKKEKKNNQRLKLGKKI